MEKKKIEKIKKGTDEKIFLQMQSDFDPSGYVEVTPIIDKLNEIIDYLNQQKEKK